MDAKKNKSPYTFRKCDKMISLEYKKEIMCEENS